MRKAVATLLVALLGTAAALASLTSPASGADGTTSEPPGAVEDIQLELVAPNMVDLGQPIPYDLVIYNTGTTPITGVTVQANTAPGCAGAQADLPAGTTRHVQCSILPTQAGVVSTTMLVTTASDGSFALTAETEVVVPPCTSSPFPDVTSANPFLVDICWMDDEGITQVPAGQLFKPASAVTRQAMSAFMYRLAGEPAFDPPEQASFTDVATSSQFFTEIEWMASVGVTTGYPNGTFRPALAVTRAAMSAFMYRLAGEPAFDPPEQASFSDVPTSSQFFNDIEWMWDAGIAYGYADGTFQPGSSVKRQSMAAFMHRFAEGPGVGI